MFNTTEDNPILVAGRIDIIKSGATPITFSLDLVCSVQVLQGGVDDLFGHGAVGREFAPGDRRDAVRFSGALPVYVYSGDDSLQFETVDYSEFGMYMRDITNDEADVIAPGSEIMGQIGSQDHTLVDFHGECLRVERREDGVFYAVRLHHVGEMQR